MCLSQNTKPEIRKYLESPIPSVGSWKCLKANLETFKIGEIIGFFEIFIGELDGVETAKVARSLFISRRTPRFSGELFGLVFTAETQISQRISYLLRIQVTLSQP
jgi:hypothetical protein